VVAACLRFITPIVAAQFQVTESLVRLCLTTDSIHLLACTPANCVWCQVHWFALFSYYYQLTTVRNKEFSGIDLLLGSILVSNN
jgi:hypothetical protein